MIQPLLAAALVGTGLALAACTAETGRSSRAAAPAVTIAGEPINCIQTSRIRNTRVQDDYTIDFELSGGEVYRNTLPRRCPQLGFEERFSHSSTTGQLCSVDTVTVLHSDGARGAGCGLGQFVPVRYAAAR
jgi:hypothetical protein